MNAYDDPDGCACQHCGEDSVDTVFILGHEHPVPLCGICLDDAVEFCTACDRRMWKTDGARPFGTANTYCTSCTQQIEDAAKSHRLPDMNQIRRG